MNKYKIGVEVEKLRCTSDGNLSLKKHPKEFGNKFKNKFFSTDFGEAQMELRTPVCCSTKECYTKLDTITNIALNVLNKKNELLWPYSMPCILPKKEDFLFGEYGKEKATHEYEMSLVERYGYKMHCISGVHVNFSTNKKFLKEIKKVYPDIPSSIDDVYLKIMRNFLSKAWMLVYFLSASPLDYKNNKKSEMSIRSGNNGFANKKSLNIDLSSRINYVKCIQDNIKRGNIMCASEFYIPIRAKSKEKENILEDLQKSEIDHIEVRVCDLNPFDICGISKNDLDFTIAFLFYCLVDDTDFSMDYKKVADNGIDDEERKRLLKELEKIIEINDKLDLDLQEGINEKYDLCKKNKTRAKQVIDFCKKNGVIKSILSLANTYSEKADREKYTIKPYQKLEASTVVLLKDSVLRGIDFEIINEDTNFVKLTEGKHSEYVVQATKTNKDSYIFPVITDDKYFAKKLIKENGLEVSEGIMINENITDEELNDIIKKLCDKPIVIKPRTTNYGVGITVFSKNAKISQIRSAIQYAFEFGNDILIEDYAKGKEYRFVVINGKCESVIWRRSASVVGNGINTIRELIKMKNKEPWHLLLKHKIVIDIVVKRFLQNQGLDLDSIPKKNKRIFLRDNSNVSTGGESIGMTEMMPDRFKKIAEKVSKIFNAKICGVDIIIDDLDKEEYTIIEINDNPGISSSEWPYEGEGRNIGTKILELLGFKQEIME